MHKCRKSIPFILQVKEFSKPEGPSLGKQWSSTSTTSETESYFESHIVTSAPPKIVDKSVREPNPKGYTSKSPLQRTEAVNWAAPPVRKLRCVHVCKCDDFQHSVFKKKNSAPHLHSISNLYLANSY